METRFHQVVTKLESQNVSMFRRQMWTSFKFCFTKTDFGFLKEDQSIYIFFHSYATHLEIHLEDYGKEIRLNFVESQHLSQCVTLTHIFVQNSTYFIYIILGAFAHSCTKLCSSSCLRYFVQMFHQKMLALALFIYVSWLLQKSLAYVMFRNLVYGYALEQSRFLRREFSIWQQTKFWFLLHFSALKGNILTFSAERNM